MDHIMNLPNKYWDELAQKYPRFDDPSIQNDAKFIFENANKFGISFENKNVLDIGCGTGTLALNISENYNKIDAIDASSFMLERFKNDLNIFNKSDKINLFCSSWDDFEVKQKYDIAIASMTPAVSNVEQKMKFVQCADFGIFVGWGEYKKNDILELLFEKIGIDSNDAFGQTKRFAGLLEGKKIPFELKYFESSWSESHKLEDAIKYCQNHLQRFDKTATNEFLTNFLTEFIDNGKITMTTNAQKGLVLFTTK